MKFKDMIFTHSQIKVNPFDIDETGNIKITYECYSNVDEKIMKQLNEINIEEITLEDDIYETIRKEKIKKITKCYQKK